MTSGGTNLDTTYLISKGQPSTCSKVMEGLLIIASLALIFGRKLQSCCVFKVLSDVLHVISFTGFFMGSVENLGGARYRLSTLCYRTVDNFLAQYTHRCNNYIVSGHPYPEFIYIHSKNKYVTLTQ